MQYFLCRVYYSSGTSVAYSQGSYHVLLHLGYAYARSQGVKSPVDWTLKLQPLLAKAEKLQQALAGHDRAARTALHSTKNSWP